MTKKRAVDVPGTQSGVSTVPDPQAQTVEPTVPTPVPVQKKPNAVPKKKPIDLKAMAPKASLAHILGAYAGKIRKDGR